MMGGFCGLDLHGWDMSTTLTPGRDWEINVKHSWRNPPKNLNEASSVGDKCEEWSAEPCTEPFLKQQPLAQKTAGNCETNGISVHLPCGQNCLGNTPKNLLGGESHVLPRTQQDKHVILPQDLYYGWRPKRKLLRKMQKRVAELGDKFKEVMGEPSTEPFGWTFHRAFRDGSFWHPKTDLCWRSRDTATILVELWQNHQPQKAKKHHKTCPSLVHPCWRNLGGTFHGTLWRPKTHLLQRTIKSPKGILPRHLYYGLRPQSRCRWVEK